MHKVKVSAVSYLNSRPFIYGLQNHPVKEDIELSLDIPSVCARKVITGEADLGLVPIAILTELINYEILTNYCIGAKGPVKSVVLLSEVPLEEIKEVFLDYQSRTSVLLFQVLAEFFWNKKFSHREGFPFYEREIKGTTAGVVIGDRALKLESKYQYVIDLSQEWEKFTGLPFVFACWISNKKLDENFKTKFEEAIAFGLQNKEKAIEEFESTNESFTDAHEYLTHYIDFDFDTQKREALFRFMIYVSRLKKEV